MDALKTCFDGATGSLNFETMSHRQQENQRQGIDEISFELPAMIVA